MRSSKTSFKFHLYLTEFVTFNTRKTSIEKCLIFYLAYLNDNLFTSHPILMCFPAIEFCRHYPIHASKMRVTKE